MTNQELIKLIAEEIEAAAPFYSIVSAEKDPYKAVEGMVNEGKSIYLFDEDHQILRGELFDGDYFIRHSDDIQTAMQNILNSGRIGREWLEYTNNLKTK